VAAIDEMTGVPKLARHALSDGQLWINPE